MMIVPTSWLKVILFPFWPFALWYWWRHHDDVGFSWAPFDRWAGRVWWMVLLGALIVGAVIGLVRGK
jgi:hypothetical protein